MPSIIPATGWTLLVQRLRTERRTGKNFSRTVGTYQVFRDGQPVSTLKGSTVEREGPGDNGPVGKEDHRCIEAGTYPLRMHDTENYSTDNYETDGEHPRPAILLGDTSARSGILIHPASGYGSTIGCINPGDTLSGPDRNLDLLDSTRRVIDLINDLKNYIGGQFPEGTFPNSRIIVVDAALDQVGKQTLRLGSRGPLVRAWQAFLNTQGAQLGTPDGRFGLLTQTATIAFQTARGLRVDGIVGPTTITVARALGLGTAAAPELGGILAVPSAGPIFARRSAGTYVRAPAPAVVDDEEPSAVVEAPSTINLTPGQRLVCERIINVFETGTLRGEYGNISIFRDGPHGIRQVTYGRAQTTEYGNLRELVQMYVDAGGRFAPELRAYVPRIGIDALVDDDTFKRLLRRAGNEDPVMAQTQDVFFEKRYFQPAKRWAEAHGFTRALSMLVIYNSFIHSGSILPFLRDRFPERPPSEGGDEKEWIRQYVDVRHAWLRNHSNLDLRPTIYRTRDLKREIERGNWDLALLPISANGTGVDDRVDAGPESPIATMDAASAASVARGYSLRPWAASPEGVAPYEWRGLDKSTFLRRNRTRLLEEIAAVNAILAQTYGTEIVSLSEQDVWVLNYIEAGLSHGRVDPDFEHSLGERGMLPLPENVRFWNGPDAPAPNRPMPLETNLHHFYLYLGHLMNKKVKETPRFTLYEGLFRWGSFRSDPVKKVQLLAAVVHGYFLSTNYSDRQVPFDHILDGFDRGEPADVVMRPTKYVHAGRSVLTNRARNIAEALTLLAAAGPEAAPEGETVRPVPMANIRRTTEQPEGGRSPGPKRYKLKFREKEGLRAAISGPEAATISNRLTDWHSNVLAVEANENEVDAAFEDRAAKMAEDYGAELVPDVQYDIDDIYAAGPESDMDPTLDEVVQMIRADRVWGRARGAGVTIAVIDTGVEGTRPEFRNKVGWHRGLSARPSLDAWSDTHGHGTMCAAIAAGQGGMGTARNGIAPDAGILPCRTPQFYDSEVVYFYGHLINRARNGETIVVTNSFGLNVGEAPPLVDRELIDKLKEAEAAGIHIFFSAGNNHELTGASHTACQPNSIWLHKSYDCLATVGTCDLDRNLWSYSSRGPGQFFGEDGTKQMPDVVAPTPRNGRVAFGTADRTLMQGWGTSGACPQVAGLAALILSLDPKLRPAEVRELIRSTASGIGGLSDTCQGRGMIDCEAAVARVPRTGPEYAPGLLRTARKR